MVVVATKHAKASLMDRIAMAVLVAVDDRRHCPKTKKASLGTVESVSWNYLAVGQAADYVALAGDSASGLPDGDGMIVDCTQQYVISGHLLKMMESQRSMKGETVAAEWR